MHVVPHASTHTHIQANKQTSNHSSFSNNLFSYVYICLYIYVVYIHVGSGIDVIRQVNKQTNKKANKQTNNQPCMFMYISMFMHACFMCIQPFVCKINTSMVCQRFKQTQALFPCSERDPRSAIPMDERSSSAILCRFAQRHKQTNKHQNNQTNKTNKHQTNKQTNKSTEPVNQRNQYSKQTSNGNKINHRGNTQQPHTKPI
jgi:hypothetical protein